MFSGILLALLEAKAIPIVVLAPPLSPEIVEAICGTVPLRASVGQLPSLHVEIREVLHERRKIAIVFRPPENHVPMVWHHAVAADPHRPGTKSLVHRFDEGLVVGGGCKQRPPADGTVQHVKSVLAGGSPDGLPLSATRRRSSRPASLPAWLPLRSPGSIRRRGSIRLRGPSRRCGSRSTRS